MDVLVDTSDEGVDQLDANKVANDFYYSYRVSLNDDMIFYNN